MQSENEFQIELMNDFKAHGLRSMCLLELAMDEHRKEPQSIERVRLNFLVQLEKMVKLE